MKALIRITALGIGLLFTLVSFAQSTEQTEETAENQPPNKFAERVQALNGRSFNAKIKAIETLSESKDPRVLPILKAMLDKDQGLYYRKSDDTIVTVEEVEDGLQLTDVLTGEDLGVVGKRDARKIGINNKVRNVLKSAIAVLELGADEKHIRLQSAQNLLKSPDKNLLSLLEERAELEDVASIKHLLEVAIALIKIDSDDQKVRLQAVEVLSSSVEPEAVNVVRKLAEVDEAGTYIEADLKVAELADAKLKSVETKLAMYRATENIFFGLSLGSVFLLAAIGLAITFGVMGVINMAHGEMIMIGAYTTFFVQQAMPNLIEASLFVAIPLAFLVSGAVGVLIERTIIRHLYGRPLDTLLATFGVGLILQQAARTYNSNNVPVITPSWMSSAWAPNGAISFNYNRIYILFFALVVLFSLALLLKKTLFGLQMRAVTQNRPMASSMGIRQNRVDALTFGLGSGIAGIAGVALSQITNVGPNLGSAYIIDSFMVVVFGGVGSLIGTFFGAFGLGVINKLLEPSFGAVVGKILVLIFIILFIQWRPRGLFALKGRFVED